MWPKAEAAASCGLSVMATPTLYPRPLVDRSSGNDRGGQIEDKQTDGGSSNIYTYVYITDSFLLTKPIHTHTQNESEIIQL